MNGSPTGGEVGRMDGDGFASMGGRIPAVQGQPLFATPPGKVLIDGYRKDILSGFEKDQPQYNPLNVDRPQSSALVDLKDPIQVHLLTETALSDSKSFVILSQEEVDELKKQVQSLTTRIEQARANLAIQTKYRDAAVSMARLYSSPKAEGRRTNSLGNRMSDSAKAAEMERLACERRCEELAAELFSLEKRLVELQRRLLQHTAGILQLTHRASSKKQGQVPLGPMMNGIPSSPESLYTYTNARGSMEIPSEELNLDDRDLYLPVDQADGPGARPRKNTIDIPMKSPIREQNAQLRELREELERIKEENERLLGENTELKTAEAQLRDDVSRLQGREQELMDQHARVVEENARIKDETNQFKDESSRLRDAHARLGAIEQQMNAETEALRAQNAGQLKTISDTEARLEVLNRKLRGLIVAFNPAKNGGFDTPGTAAGSGEALEGQLEYLERGLAIAAEHAADSSNAAEEAVAMAPSLDKAQADLEQARGRVQALARQVQLVLQQSNLEHPAHPEGSIDEQIDYLETAVQTVGSELSRALETSTSASAKKQSIEQVDAVLMGLWEIIQTGHAEMEQQRAARKQNRAMGQDPVGDDDDLSSNEFDGGPANEPYSLQAFSSKVQWLYAQATGLREQKYILQRQIKQQRELNNRSESEKDRELQAKTEELQQTQMLLDDAEQAARDAQAQLERALADMETLQKTTAANEAAAASSSKAAQDQLNAKLAALEAEAQEARSRLAAAESEKAATQSRLDESAAARANAETELAAIREQLSAAVEASAAADADAARLQRELRERDEELDRMNSMVVELKTEVAIAKAELDGAYGSRKQRAAEAAAAAAAAAAGAGVGGQDQVVRLKGELENALKDLEEITAESIRVEKERMEMEGRLDEAEARAREVEAEMERLRRRMEEMQEQLDREKLRSGGAGGDGSGGGGRAGATMLSEQFRGVMKEERRRFQEELREEQTRRRKLEEELRALKRGQGSAATPTKGALSPR